jgi:hypothetical protein
VELLRLYSNRQSPQVGCVMSGEMIALLVERYLGGSAVKDLAAEFGVHRTTVASVLQRQDIKLRQVGLNEDMDASDGRTSI